ncbi:hypothetical protein [Halobacteriovorax sp. RT-2-4]|uniref:hypothetical protein n=1 Tax=unclassified Halobacteriovorax TaxID=2639665 RepID=UPI00399BB245
MRKLILFSILALSTQLSIFAASGKDSANEATPDCLENAIPNTLDSKNTNNIEQIVELQNVRSHGANPNYPIFPDNIDEILKPDKRTVCDAYAVPNEIDPSYRSVMKHIDKTYKDGDHKDFFFRYVLSMNCWPFRENFFAYMIKGGNVGHAMGNIMKSPYGGLDPNAFIRIEREGRVFEGPMYHVYEYLEKNYKNKSESSNEYIAAMKRLKSSRYQLYPVKSLNQIKKEEPNMPISIR